MGATEEVSKITTGVLDGLKAQPLALALIVLNLVFLGVGYSMWSKTSTLRAEYISNIMKSCLDVTAKPSGFGPGAK